MSIHIQYIRNSVIRSAIACTHFPENNGEIRKNDTTQSGSNFDTYSTFVNSQATFAKMLHIFSLPVSSGMVLSTKVMVDRTTMEMEVNAQIYHSHNSNRKYSISVDLPQQQQGI